VDCVTTLGGLAACIPNNALTGYAGEIMSVLGAIIGKSYPELKEKALWLLSNLVANGS